MDARHLYAEQRPDGSYRIWLIDCEGVHRARRQSAQARDIQRLIRSLRNPGSQSSFADLLAERLNNDALAEMASKIRSLRNSAS